VQCLLSVSVVINVVTSKFTTLVKLFCKHYLENRKIYDLAIDFYNLIIWNYYNVPPILDLSGRIQIIGFIILHIFYPYVKL